MKIKFLALGLSAALAGCTSPPVHKLTGYDGPEAMHRKEIVQASKECTDENMRPKVEYVSQKINSGGRVMIPINVHCDPVTPPGGYHAPRSDGYYPQPNVYYPTPRSDGYYQNQTQVSTTPFEQTYIIPSTYGNTPVPIGAGRRGAFGF